jgi:riboflavin kinase/FMN adenylyltransferase
MAARTVVSIGIFDGVHLGHRALIAAARRFAVERGLKTVAVTFDPLPVQVLRPAAGVTRLTDIDQRAALLRQAGADAVLVIEPTREFLDLSAAGFVQMLVAEHAPAAVVEGADFRFGHARRGDIAMLTAAGRELGFETVVVPKVRARLSDLTAVSVSSSLVRWLTAQGRTLDAAAVLGRPFELAATVVEGERRGRTLGFPTVNLDPAALATRALPGDGVYAGEAHWPGGQTRAAAISIGIKPTLPGAPRARTVEAHLLDFSGDLYGKRVTLRFGRYLREQRVFPALAALQAQMARDLAYTRQLYQRGLLLTLAGAAGP